LYTYVKSAYTNHQKEKEKELEKQMPLQQSWELASHFEKIKSQARQRQQQEQQEQRKQQEEQEHQEQQEQERQQQQQQSVGGVGGVGGVGVGVEQQPPSRTTPERRSFERAAAATQNQFKWIDDV
jgi:hypothetical protein